MQKKIIEFHIITKGGGFFTYKHDFEKIVIETKIMQPVQRVRYWINPMNEKLSILKKKQLDPFSKLVNYYSRKLVVFKKDYNLLKIKTKNEFKK